MKINGTKSKLLAALLAIMMVFTGVITGGTGIEQAYADDSVTVYFTVSTGGSFATDKDGGSMIKKPVVVTEKDNDSQKKLSLNDALICAHEQYMSSGAAAYGYTDSSYGCTVSKLWNVSTTATGFYKNDVMTDTVDKTDISNGDCITAFTYSDTASWSDIYTYFDKKSASVEGGQLLELKLSGTSWSGSAVPETVITVNGEKTNYEPDEEGNVSMYLPSEGSYLISAQTKSDEDYIVPPFCNVQVSGNDDMAGVVAQDKAALTLASEATSDLNLPVFGKSGKTSLMWETSDSSVISKTGKVTRSDENKTVTMTATLKYGTKTDTKAFTVSVPALNDENLISEAKTALTAASPITPSQWNSDYSGPGDTNIVTMAQAVVDKAAKGVKVAATVQSDNTSTIAADGSIAYKRTAKTANVQLTLTKGAVSDTVSIVVKVPRETVTKQSVMDQVVAGLSNGNAILKDNVSLSEIVGNLNFTNLSSALDYNDYYVDLTWEIPETAKNNLDRFGKVTRPAYGSGDLTFKLGVKIDWKTAMNAYSGYVGKDPQSEKIELDLTIKAVTEAEYNSAKSIVDSYIDNFDTDTIVLFADKSKSADLSGVKENIFLPDPSPSGMTATWTSDNVNAVSNPSSGYGRAVVSRPDAGKTDASCNLTLTLSKDGYSNSKVIPVVVKALTNEEIAAEQAKIQKIADALTFDVIKKDNTLSSAVTQTLNLWRSASEKEDGTISWSKSANQMTGYNIEWTYTDNVKEYGTVSREEDDVNVNLAAVVTSADKSAYTHGVNVNIPLTVLGKSTDKLTKVNGLLEKIAGSYTQSYTEWIVMDMSAYAGYNPSTQFKLSEGAKQTFINNAIKTVTNPKSGDTALDKAVIALAGVGADPEKLYEVNSNTPVSAIEKLNGVTHSSSAWSAPYTLASYNQGNFGTGSLEDDLIEKLLANQKENGSWDEFGTIDTTANVITGLSFYSDREAVKKAVAKGIDYLASQMSGEGTYTDGFNGYNANSTSMVVIALASAGINPDTDARFIKNGRSLLDGLLSFALADNSGFGHKNNTTFNAGATEQGFRALIAAAQVLSTKKAYNVYDFSGNTLQPVRATGQGQVVTPGTSTGDTISVKVTIKSDTDYWLNNAEITIPGSGAKVYHAFIAACSKAGITHVGAERGYVSSMTKGSKTLEQFTSGANSGWMYKVNDILPTVGLTDYDIKDGDNIVWFYTDDWTSVPSTILPNPNSGSEGGDSGGDKQEESLSPSEAKIVAGVENTTIKAKSMLRKKSIKITWKTSKGYKVDYYQIFRSTKRSSGYGAKPFFTTKSGKVRSYVNTKSLKKGVTYYYKVRGVRIIDGKKYYTKWSNKAYRKIK